MAELVRQGIEAANEELKRESDTRLMNEVKIEPSRQVTSYMDEPAFGLSWRALFCTGRPPTSTVSWLPPQLVVTAST